jgi:Flp pilus assembly protein TadD
MATGHPAFSGTTSAVIFEAILNKAPTSPVRLNPEVPRKLEEIISKALEKDRQMRCQSAAELRTDLKRLRRDTDSGRAATVAAVSDRRTPVGTPALQKWWVVAVAALLLGAAGAAAFWYFHRKPALTEKDFILLTDFTNTTGDPVFDGTLRTALAVGLNQSPYLNVFSDEKVQQTLKLMSRPPDTRITSEVGREICQRDGVKAMLTGSIASLGTQYVITLEAVNAATGDTLGEEQAQAASKEQVLNALGGATSKLRAQLGESLASIQHLDKPLDEATTSSLDALKAFSLGDAQFFSGDNTGAIPFFQRAIELDPNFAMAYLGLGVAESNVGQSELSAEYRRKAFELRDRASERERLHITAHYYAATGQIEEWTRTWELCKQIYPRDPGPYINLANSYIELGQFDKAQENGLEAVRLGPDNAIGYENLAEAYVCLSRLEEAKAILNRAVQRKLGGHIFHLWLSNIAIAQGDRAAQEREDTLIKRDAEGELGLASRDASLAASRGQLKQARELFLRASQMAQRLNLQESAAEAIADEAGIEANFGYRAEAAKGATAALTISRAPAVVYSAARTLALAGEANQAESLMAELAKRRPESAWVQAVEVPEIKAINAINRRDPAKAIELLQAATPYDRGTRFGGVRYTRGNAYLRGGNGHEAEQEFQSVLALRNWLWALWETPLAPPFGVAARTRFGPRLRSSRR